LLALAVALQVVGCAARVAVHREPPSPPRQELPRTGYSIQLGAFSRLQNAQSLVKTLQREGLRAYYFRHVSGLYKVRFGDYPTEGEARERVEALLKAGIIDAYYLVKPKDYAVAKARIYGDAALREEIVTTAESFIGLPYQWGGSSPEKGFDCSGLAMAVYEMNGLVLPRTSSEQFTAGNPVNLSNLAKGDLVFFAVSEKGKATHVGVYAGTAVSFTPGPRKDDPGGLPLRALLRDEMHWGEDVSFLNAAVEMVTRYFYRNVSCWQPVPFPW